MRIHILGICGTFMAGAALLARQMGHEVSGSDSNVYPPMSTQLEAEGIELCEGYEATHLMPEPDLVVVGNALSRGNPAVEYLLERGIPYTSGPQFLSDYLLQEFWVLAVAGTHGKTTTASMLAWILEYAGLDPSFLIGGIPNNFGLSARLGETPFFIIEADEYDTAFFDKRSKFVHYRPRTVVLNNLEFDHADIFPDLDAIKRQFHHLLRTVPGNGLVIAPLDDSNVIDVISQGCWTPLEYFDSSSSVISEQKIWNARNISAAAEEFEVYWGDGYIGSVNWSLIGRHNLHNALAALAAARHVGVIPADAVTALNEFEGVKRRLEIKGVARDITIYDDFAHHPTAITLTLEGLRHKVGSERIIAVVEPRSNTMRMGVHRAALAPSLKKADEVIFYQPPQQDSEQTWDLQDVTTTLGEHAQCFSDIDSIIHYLASHAHAGDHILIMSNGGFGGIHQRLLQTLEQHES